MYLNQTSDIRCFHGNPAILAHLLVLSKAQALLVLEAHEHEVLILVHAGELFDLSGRHPLKASNCDAFEPKKRPNTTEKTRLTAQFASDPTEIKLERGPPHER